MRSNIRPNASGSAACPRYGHDVPTWTTGIEFYRRVDYDLFILDYRGYGKSTGALEREAQLDADGR